VTTEIPEVGEEISDTNLEFDYFPLTPTILCRSSQIKLIKEGDAFQHKQVIGLLSHSHDSSSGVFEKTVILPNNPLDYGLNFDGALIFLDDANLDLIIIEEPSQSEEWMEINYRLLEISQPMVPKTDEEFLTAWDFIKLILTIPLILGYFYFNDYK
jgi:hypothetical protein